ncbi:uncharacterized protein MONOS_10613 [Monocercomonoides exilis]|uniref:uncharacterized protein n=1 Tax=Monocercomonoides exilis TaxID=2049356 RepID=UPI003559701D|nr:hypothetical protein MONOS_10613 [Monocercomonoides exilis]|eukprot:MONOS_10613.1-p1 / transcript=MONOS_10613.1 / gene=MONOS_10613 / organism=Monocercomonoides_exilis_PA203 / gene_product=unspecified product / transcript_product=unspecified product / location=Mono_scaffold00489:36362-37432(+) / protein_length=332 / sequence_SO=supercontig / SO=protein_coding / is_pseudo=false
MIAEEENKKDEKNEKLLVDLCEYYLLLDNRSSSELILICVPCLVKAASNKENSEEVQKEVEIALLALSFVGIWKKIDRELYLNEITEIIKYHQKHRNLTHLAYLLAWQFLVSRFCCERSLEYVITYELHFAREATRELNELIKCVDWKRKQEEKEEKEEKEAKDILALMGWFEPLEYFLDPYKIGDKEFVGLVGSIVQVLRATKENNGDANCVYTYFLRKIVENGAVKADDLLKSGTVDIALEELQQATLNNETVLHCLLFLLNLSWRLEKKEKDEKEETKRKEMKRKALEKTEEEGFEDIIESFPEILVEVQFQFGFRFPFIASDYFVNT